MNSFQKSQNRPLAAGKLVNCTANTNRIIDQFVQYLEQLRYSENSIKSYAEGLKTFFRFLHNPDPSSVTLSDIERFNLEYIIRRDYSESYQNLVINAIKIFFRKHQNVHFKTDHLERPRSRERLPTVLSLSEVESLLNSIANLKHRTMLSIIYSCGLRMGELLDLEIRDVDSKRMVIHIKNAKGKKDRIVPLSASVLDLLRVYYLDYRPHHFLFNGESGNQYSRSSLQTIFRRAVVRAGILKKCTLHTLRHSYATHLLENGVNLRYIQDLLGHKSPNTTMIYTHVTSDESRKVISTIEQFSLRKD